jgi:hypothetical protein
LEAVKATAIEEAVRGSKYWETRGNDIPDVIDAQDYRDFPEATGLIVGRRVATAEPRWAESFPYPKSHAGVRQFVLTDALDNFALRYIATSVVTLADSRLGANVISSRLQRTGDGWFTGFPSALRTRVDAALAHIDDASFCGFGVADITSYYQNINRPRLWELQDALGANPGAVAAISHWLDAMMAKARVEGLPIGHESSAVLANSFLLPFDGELTRVGLSFYRLMDDSWLLPSSLASWQTFRSVGSFVLDDLGLEFAPTKTKLITDRDEAYCYVRDSLLTYVQAALDFDDAVGLVAIQHLVDVVHDDPQPSAARFRFAIRASRRRADPYAVHVLAARPELLELDPHVAGDYIRLLATRARRHVTPFVPEAFAPRTDRRAAVQLLVLRAMSELRWGSAEATDLDRLLADPSTPTPIRSIALVVRSRAPGWSADDAVDIAIGNESFVLRRAAVVSLREVANERKRARAAGHCAARDPDFLPTALYVMAA